MAEITHKHARITSGFTTTTPQTWQEAMSISASELTDAGFAANDEVAVFYWINRKVSDTDTRAQTRIQYGNVSQGPTDDHMDFSVATRHRNSAWMVFVDLGGTVLDLDMDLRASSAGDSATITKGELMVVKLADLGVENTDWFRATSTTTVLHTTTYSPTDRAAVTWTPASVEDWVVFGSIHINSNNSIRQLEAQLTLDGTRIAGDMSEEAEHSAEHRRFLIFDMLEALSDEIHTLEVESRDDGSTGNQNEHEESHFLVFRKDIFDDIYIDEPGTVSVTNDTDVQVATITDTLSATQNAVILGNGNLNQDVIHEPAYFWIREGGSTVIDPVVNFGTGFTAIEQYDTTDHVQGTILAYKSLASGALDLDLFCHQTGSASHDLLLTKFLVWGLELAVAGGDASANLTTIVANVTIDTVATTTSASVSATAIVANVTIDQTTQTASATANTTAIVAAVTIDQPTTTTSAAANLTAIVVPVTIDTVTTTTSATANATAILATVTIDQPVVTFGGDATANLTAIAAIVTVDATTQTASAEPVLTAIVAVVTIDTVTTTTSANATAAAIVAVVTIDAPTTTTSASATLATIVVQVTIDQPVATGGGSATANLTAIAVLVTIDTVTTATSASASATAVVATVFIDQATVVSGATATLTAIVASVTIDQPTTTTSASVNATAVVASVTIDQMTSSTSASVALSSIVVPVTLDSVALTASATATLNTIVAPVTIDTPVSTTSANAGLTTIVVPAVIDTVTTTASAMAALTTIVVPVTMPSVSATDAIEALFSRVTLRGRQDKTYSRKEDSAFVGKDDLDQ